jgi:hypothetical protein
MFRPCEQEPVTSGKKKKKERRHDTTANMEMSEWETACHYLPFSPTCIYNNKTKKQKLAMGLEPNRPNGWTEAHRLPRNP